MSVSESNDIGSGNVNKNNSYPIQRVDDEAARLSLKFGNFGYEAFYCKAIYILGIPRVRDIEGRVADAKYPGRLFTKLLKEDMDRVDRNRTRSDKTSR